MERSDAIRQAAAEHGLQLDDQALDQLAAGEEVELRPDGSDCCPDGWIGIGHKPRWCFKLSNPPRVKICWG